MIVMTCGDALVGRSISVADTFGSRFMGLMFRRKLEAGSGMLLMPCGSIHMCFMRMALDIVYMDAEYHVIAVQKGLKPWRLGAQVRGARLVLELPVGAIERSGIEPGMVLKVEQPANDVISNDEMRGTDGYERSGSCCES